jgi:hypothetical protein
MSLTKVSFSMITGATVNVLDYGATGNGNDDDTTAIQAAIVAAAGKTLYFPAGIYLVGDLSIIGRQITMIGDGMKSTELKAKAGATHIINAEELTDVQASQFQINNFTLNGQATTKTTVLAQKLAAMARDFLLLAKTSPISSVTK